MARQCNGTRIKSSIPLPRFNPRQLSNPTSKLAKIMTQLTMTTTVWTHLKMTQDLPMIAVPYPSLKMKDLSLADLDNEQWWYQLFVHLTNLVFMPPSTSLQRLILDLWFSAAGTNIGQPGPLLPRQWWAIRSLCPLTLIFQEHFSAEIYLGLVEFFTGWLHAQCTHSHRLNHNL